jgi:hypothetical protein
MLLNGHGLDLQSKMQSIGKFKNEIKINSDGFLYEHSPHTTSKGFKPAKRRQES